MEGFFLLSIIGLAVGGAAIASAARKRAVANEAWGDAARHLHLMFRPADLFTGPHITGAIGGCSVQVTTFTRSSDKARCVRYRVEFRMPHRQKLEIRERGRLADLRRIFGQDFVEFGDAEFDGRFEVHAQEGEAIREFLNPLRRRRLLDLYREFPGTVIERHRLTWESKAVPTVAAMLVRSIQRLAAAADDLSPGAASRAVEPIYQPPLRKLRPQTPELAPQDTARPARPRRAAPSASSAPPPPPQAPKVEAPRRPAPAPTPQPDREPEPAPPPPSAPEPTSAFVPVPGTAPAPAPSPDEVARAMFGSTAATPDIQATFEREFKDRTVRWAGELTSVSRYPFDRVFGSTPGTRAVFHICDVETSLGRRPVQAVVQLPEHAVTGMRTGVGTGWTFEGTLALYDGFMRTVFVTGGRIVARPSTLPSGRPD